MASIETIYPEVENQVVVDHDFMMEVLQPYRSHTTYLKKAIFQKKEEEQEKGLMMKGEFGIADSCYIDDTGHFNAVEFNICFNQLAYVFYGYCIKEGLIPELKGFESEHGEVFLEKQLSHFLIASISSSYRSQINAKHFYGEVGIDTISKKSNCTFIKMYCSFQDETNGKSKGDITLAILHP
ncbi:FcoT family thioesterase [Aquimarina hainanensis]|uniref:FcoT family thioesterase n=1 Tax=Aquimarina hainanensis TaxID=1578017 RepID=A0ABW5N716_9FLAO|nr:FcoT family thioesterase [Aquimarina sp. TRL1]